MPSSIPLDHLAYYLQYFMKLKEAKLEFEIHKNEVYVSAEKGMAIYKLEFNPVFKHIKSIRGLADIWNASLSTFLLSSINEFDGTITSAGVPGVTHETPSYASIQKNMNTCEVDESLYRTNLSAIKFYAASVFDQCESTKLYYISGKVPEVTIDNHTIRTCIYGSRYNSGRVVCCCDESSPYYNYIDRGNVMVFVSTEKHLQSGSRVFVTDTITLDMNYIIAAAMVFPPAIDGVLQHKAFLPSKDSRLTLLKVERMIPSNLREKYLQIKNQIQEDFSKNTANVMIGKLAREESPFIELNGIRITSTRAEYTAGRISIEAPNLAKVIFAKLNPNEAEWDVFSLLNIYTDWVNDQFKSLEMNATATGFLAEKSFTFTINNIPLTVSCGTDNTRRSINGHLINVDELSPVLRRASCYQAPVNADDEDNVKNYDVFLRDVSRYSLKTRDIWRNGLPVKTMFLETDFNNYGMNATMKHPKLRFVLKNKKEDKNKGFYLLVNVMDAKDKTKIASTNEYKVGKFAEFINKVEQLNRTTHTGYSGAYQRTTDGFYALANGAMNRCAQGLVNLLPTYATGITEDDKKSIIGVINYEQTEAEKRSEELLQEACLLTKSVKGTRDGKTGYIVPGKMRTYFVEDAGNNKIWGNTPKDGGYFCVVNKGDMGVGKDALIARIFALHNDEMMAKKITTLSRQ
jgi:hypothetical protein